MASQVGSASVAIFPIFKGFRRITDKAVQDATNSANKVFSQGFNRGAQQTGTTSGKAFSKGFTDGFTITAPKTLSQLQGAVATASRSLSSARLAEADALGKVNVAQANYVAAQKRYKDGAPQLVKAFETLSSSQRRYAAAQDVTTAASGRLKASQQQLSSSLDQIEKKPSRVGIAFQNLGGAIGDGFGNVAGLLINVVGGAVQTAIGIATAGAITVTAALGGILAAGFTRLSSIETAQAKLKALGNTQENIAIIMANANEAVIGTQYSLADAVTAAASAVAAGIKPGEQLTNYLKLNANAAAVAGVAFSDLSLVMNQVRSQGKAYTQDINQIASRGIPIWQGLQEVYGVTRDKLSEMVRDGEIDADHFEAALRLKVGNAAKEMGKTTAGSFENVKAAVARFGAALLSPVFPFAEKIFTGISTSLDKRKAALQPIIDKYGPGLAEAFGKILDQAGPFFDQVVQKLIDWANSPEGQKFFADLSTNLTVLGATITANLPSFLNLIVGIGKLIAYGTLFATATAPIFITSLAGVSDTLGLVGSNFGTLFQRLSDGTIWDVIAQKFQTGWNQLVAPFIQGYINITTWTNNIQLTVAQWATRTLAPINNFRDRVQMKLAEVVLFFQSLPGRLLATVANAGSWLVNAGRQVVQGFINGIGQLAPTIGKAFLNLVPAFIRGPFEQALGIHSPSRVFFRYGEQTMEGYELGVDSKARSVANTLSGIVPAQTGSSIPVSTGSAALAGATRTAPLIGTVVAPDQNPVASGRIIGEEIDRLLKGTGL